MKTAHVITTACQEPSFNDVKLSFEPFGITCLRELGATTGRPAIECTKSHLNLVRRAQQESMQEIMVFESDCMPCPAMRHWENIWRFLERNRRHWDLFYGGATAVFPRQWQCNYTHDNQALVQCSHALSVHFVVYNRSSYAKVLAWFDLPMAEECRPVIDDYLQRSDLRLWTCTPMLAVQRPSYSRTLGRDVDYSDAFKRAEGKLRTFVEGRRRSLAYRIFVKWLRSI